VNIEIKNTKKDININIKVIFNAFDAVLDKINVS
jgi:hypothetical protein